MQVLAGGEEASFRGREGRGSSHLGPDVGGSDPEPGWEQRDPVPRKGPAPPRHTFPGRLVRPAPQGKEAKCYCVKTGVWVPQGKAAL